MKNTKVIKSPFKPHPEVTESMYGASEKHKSYGKPPADFNISREHVKPPPPGHDPESARRVQQIGTMCVI